MNLRATFATASLVFASTLIAATYSLDVKADSVANQPVQVSMAVKQNPVPATDRSVQIGLKDYSDACFGCHGPTEISSSGASQLSNIEIADMTDGELFWLIKHGHADQISKSDKLSPRQIWHLINYLRSE